MSLPRQAESTPVVGPAKGVSQGLTAYQAGLAHSLSTRKTENGQGRPSNKALDEAMLDIMYARQAAGDDAWCFGGCSQNR